MTREEIINNLLYMKRYVKEDTIEDSTIDEAIKALEQQPCEDCISRQDVNDLVEELARVISDERCCISRGKRTIMQDILDLPSVTPKEKTGHRRLTNPEWIDFLSEQFDISRTSAKEMLHAMMSVKKEDNFKKQFDQGFSQDRKRGE